MKLQTVRFLSCLIATATICVFCGILFTAGCKPSPEPAYTLHLKRMAGAFTNPTALAEPRDGTGRLFITEQTGAIKIIKADGSMLPEPFLDVKSRMVRLSSAYDESGLLGLVFHPDFAANGRFFIYYNAPPKTTDPQGYHSNARVAEFLVSPADADKADADSEKVLLDVPHPEANHNAGQLAFGPDGFLYIGIGDGGNANDVGLGHNPDSGNGQDTTQLLGKILRLDVSTPGSAAIPAGNPFAGDPVRKGEIFAYGFRNPWRFSFDRGGENRLFCGDVGQSLYEEINIVTAGGNYGWHIKEGASCFNKDKATQPLVICPDNGSGGEPLINPIIVYGHPGDNGTITGRSVTGGYVYRGSAIPALAGAYVFGDWSKSFIKPDGSLFIASEGAGGLWQLKTANVQYEGGREGKLGRFLLSFGQDEDGELYLLTSRKLGPVGRTGEVYKLVAAESHE
jgi:glucose/arabinose dehydrogenase